MEGYTMTLALMTLVLMLLQLTDCAFVVTSNGDLLTTGDHCIDSCAHQQDGHYQSCKGCDVYASCKDGLFRDTIPCGKRGERTTYWNEELGMCTTWKSGMCKLSIFKKEDDTNRPGLTYIRWGRTVCPDTARAVYAGYVAGSLHNHAGGGSNYLCLPRDPLWSNYTSALDRYRAYLYGAEYKYEASFPIGGKTNSLDNHDVPCVLCKTTATALFMLPGRNWCFDGWVTEYSGYLSAQYHTSQHRTEFVCLDGQPEHDNAGYASQTGAYFYPVEGRCGSLPCPPYVNGRELSCAVCTQ